MPTEMRREATARMITHRSEALAMVALTRLPEVNPVRIDLGDIDFFAFLPGEKPDGFRFIGVIVKGTQRVGSKRAADEWAKETGVARTIRDNSVYLFPTLVLLCSMEDETVYHAWLMEPGIDPATYEPRLARRQKLEFEEFDADALREAVEKTRAWYDAMTEELVT